MNSVFSDYVRSLGPTGEPGDAELEEMWTELRRVLRRGLQSRGLWDRSPSFLGMPGHTTWTSPETSDRRGLPQTTRDALDELAFDFYDEMFLTRLPVLQRYVEDGDDIEKVVVLGVGQFLRDRLKKLDPLGFRLFQWLRSALRQALGQGRLFLLAGSSKIRNDTVLGFDPETRAEPAREEVLEAEVRRWNDDLFTDWVTARGREAAALVGRLEDRVLRLPAAGVEVFGFKPLVDAFKHDVRARLDALRAASPASPESATDPDEWARHIVEDDWVVKVSECVEGRLDRLPDQRRTLEKLRRLWRFLVAFARETAPPEPARSSALEAALENETLPSNRELSRILDIRHDRIPALMARLRGEAERCMETLRATLNTATLGGSAGSSGSEVRLSESRDLRQELKRRTREAYLRAAPAPTPEGLGPRAGNLYRLEECGEPGLEWLVLDVGTEAGKCLVVPADTHSWIGSSDVGVLDRDAAGPLSLRCGDGLWLDLESLRGRQHGASLAEEDLGRARTRREQVRSGNVDATADEHETDVDPDYLDWRRTLGDAREALVDALDACPDEPRRANVVPMPARGARRRERGAGSRGGFRLLAVAASVAVVLTSGFLLGRLVEEGRLDPRISEMEAAQRRLEEERDELARKLETERDRFEEERQRDRAGHEEAVAALEERLEARIAELESPEAGVPWLLVYGDSVRGEPKSLVVPAGKRWISLSVADAQEGDRVEIRDRGENVVWSETVGELFTEDEVWIVLPAALFPPDVYRVRVWRDGELEIDFPFRTEPP